MFWHIPDLLVAALFLSRGVEFTSHLLLSLEMRECGSEADENSSAEWRSVEYDVMRTPAKGNH